MRRAFRSFIFTAVIAVMTGSPSALGQEATPATPVASPDCVDVASLDLPAVTLTTADMTAAGQEGFGISSAGPYHVEDDVAYLAESLHHEADEVRAILMDAGYRGSYFSTQSLPSDAANRASPPSHEVQIGVYPFAAAQGAAAGYLRGVADRFAGSPLYLEVTEIAAAPALGDESVALELTRETDGVRWNLNEFFIRVGNIVTVSWIERPDASLEGPEVAIEPLAELAEAQVACLVVSGPCAAVPVPAGLPGIAATPAATPAQ